MEQACPFMETRFGCLCNAARRTESDTADEISDKYERERAPQGGKEEIKRTRSGKFRNSNYPREFLQLVGKTGCSRLNRNEPNCLITRRPPPISV
jgi:hypothetical protein